MPNKTLLFTQNIREFYLKYICLKSGQRVNKGQILARIDDGGLSNQLAQMETQATLAKTTFERQKNLWDKIGSEIQYLQAETNYEAQMKAGLPNEAQLGKTIPTITATYTYLAKRRQVVLLTK